MTTILWISLIFSLTMYLEGLLVAALAGVASKQPTWVWPFLLTLWPFVLPILIYKAYRKYESFIKQLIENPLIGSLLGINLKDSPLLGFLVDKEKKTETDNSL